jgi:hypothetical protein
MPARQRAGNIPTRKATSIDNREKWENKSMKNKALKILSLLILALMAIPGPAFCQQKPRPAPQKPAAQKPAAQKPAPSQAHISPRLMEAFNAISQVRVYIEFYFMEAGDYPESLAQLDKDLNSLLPRDLEPVKFPRDPATGQEFVYVLGSDKKSYVLKVPDPSRYGIDKLEFTGVPWGGFARVAEDRKFRFLQMITVENIKTLASSVEYFAKDHGGKFPIQLKELIPGYIKSMPVCPITGGIYNYTIEGDNYSISAPRPDVYGLKELMFSSSRGWVTR